MSDELASSADDIEEHNAYLAPDVARTRLSLSNAFRVSTLELGSHHPYDGMNAYRTTLGRCCVRIALAGSVVLGAQGIAGTSHAQSQAELREARTTFQAGLALEAAGDWKGALVKFREVAGIKTTPQVLFHIGRCLEHLGRWNESVGTYRMAVDQATQAKAKDVLQQADEARKSLEARIPRIRILRGKGAMGAVVSLDGVELGGASIGTDMPVDPGAHKLTATVGGEERFSTETIVKEGGIATVTIDIEDTKAAPTPTPQPKPTPTEPTEVGPSSRTGYIFLGAGATSILVGGMFVMLRNDTIDKLDQECVNDHCPASLESTSNRGKIYAMAANGFLGVGVISAAIGTVILAQGSKEKPAANPAEKPATSETKVMLSAGGPGGPAGATVWGSF